MTCDNCFNNSCGCDPCSHPAKYGCDFDIQANPYDASIWNVTINGATKKVKIPKIAETDTKLSTSYSAAALTYNAEKHIDTITGAQLGSLINFSNLRDVDAKNADSCSIPVFHPYCSECGDGCTSKEAKWEAYNIPDAEDEVTLGEDGFYRVLGKTDCGCIKEFKLPVMANGSTQISYIRDSVPDDPDFPWYYGIYNDTINLHLRENAPAFFGKYDLKITVNYGIQVTHPTAAPNTNFRSLVVPNVQDTEVDATMFSCILQNQSTVSSSNPGIPWGTICMRGSLVFYVPKGKEASLHHEFRLRGFPRPVQYLTNALDGQRVPDSEAGVIDHGRYTMSRLNALQIVVEPARGTSNTSPVTDPERSQLDPAVDVYPNVG